MKYKFIYWQAGDVKVSHIEAPDMQTAVTLFYLNIPCEDLIRVELVDDK